MKIALLGDIHFGARNDSDFFASQIYENLDYFIRYIEANHIEAVIQLGDVFDRRKFINFRTLHQARLKFFDRLQKTGVKVYILLGNHDTYFKNTSEINSVELLLGEYDFEVVRDFQTIDLDGVKVDLIGWINEGNRDHITQSVMRSQSSIAMAHLELSEISCPLGKYYETVFSGHYHNPEEYENIVFIGNVSHFTWSDYGATKCFLIFDTSTRETDAVPFLTDVYRKIEYSDDINLSEFDFSNYRGKIVNINIPEFESVSRKKLDLFCEMLSAVGPHGVDIVEGQLFLQESSDNSFNEDGLEVGDTLSLIDKQLLNVTQTDRFNDFEGIRGYLRDVYDAANSNFVEFTEE